MALDSAAFHDFEHAGWQRAATTGIQIQREERLGARLGRPRFFFAPSFNGPPIRIARAC